MKKFFKITHSKNVTLKVYASNYISAMEKAMEITGLAFDDLSYSGVGFE